MRLHSKMPLYLHICTVWGMKLYMRRLTVTFIKLNKEPKENLTTAIEIKPFEQSVESFWLYY